MDSGNEEADVLRRELLELKKKLREKEQNEKLLTEENEMLVNRVCHARLYIIISDQISQITDTTNKEKVSALEELDKIKSEVLV